MNWKAWLPLGVAVVLGLIAARVAMNLVSVEPQAQELVPMQPIVVAARDIEPGVTLTEADVTTIRVEAAAMPPAGFAAPHQVVSKVTKIALSKGQPVMPTVLAEDGAGVGVAATLPNGMRAFTVAIDETSGVAGMIQPTCRVDVVTTLSSEGRPKAKTLLENVKVLAVGSRLDPTAPQGDQGPAKTVTLLVSPNDAEKLELASSTGRIRLLLRKGTDPSMVEGQGLTVADMKGESVAPATQPVAAINIPVGMRAYTMEVNDVTGVSGFVQPDSRVDVISTTTAAGNKTTTKTVMSAAQVLAVGTITRPNPTGVELVKTVTLLVKPRDVERLDKAAAAGKLRLSLRNAADEEEVIADASDDQDETDPFANPDGVVTPAADSAPVSRNWTIEVIKGGTRSSESVQMPTESKSVKTEMTGVRMDD